VHDRTAAVRAAANTAASWARARRAAWNAPPAIAVRIVSETPVRERAPREVLDTAPDADAVSDAAPTELRWSVGKVIGRWLPRGGVAIAAIAVLALVGAAGAFWLGLLGSQGSTTRSAAPVSAVVSAPPSAAHIGPAPVARKAVGRLSATSDPTGARVLVDGTPRGVTPLAIGDLAPGVHLVVLDSAAGSVHRSITIVADETVEIAESIFDGWVSVVAPFDVTIAEGTRALTPDDRNQVMLAPGRHELHLQNTALGYEDVRPVDVTPGETTTLSVVPPRTTITVTANAPASVWIDGVSAGDAPATAAVDLGSHDVVVKPTDRGERRFTVTATVKPVRLDVDLSRSP
jgi:PEGA domain